MAPTNFKVIIAGGGPVGLTAAHALSRAGIDFVLLERRPSVVFEAGCNLVLSPMGLRVLSQLGLLKRLYACTTPLDRATRLDHRGRDLGDFIIFRRIAENSGYPLRVVSRQDLTRVLYEAMDTETRAKLLPNKRVSDVTTTTTDDDSVTVTCEDGSTYQGSMLIGADGAHSLVRDRMRSLALAAGAPSSAVNPTQPFLTTYRCLWVRFPRPSDDVLAPGDCTEVHGAGAALQVFAGDESAVTGVYETLAEPTRERVRYGEGDQREIVERWGHLPVARGMTLKEAYEARKEAGVVSLEEGVLERWSWGGKIVLVGDAKHKFTPSTGAGCNNGIADIVVLVNKLHRAVVDAAKNSASSGPSREALDEVFTTYRDERYDKVAGACEGSGRATATATWSTTFLSLLDKWVFSSKYVQTSFADGGAKKMAGMPVLDFVAGGAEGEPEARVPFENAFPTAAMVEVK